MDESTSDAGRILLRSTGASMAPLSPRTGDALLTRRRTTRKAVGEPAAARPNRPVGPRRPTGTAGPPTPSQTGRDQDDGQRGPLRKGRSVSRAEKAAGPVDLVQPASRPRPSFMGTEPCDMVGAGERPLGNGRPGMPQPKWVTGVQQTDGSARNGRCGGRTRKEGDRLVAPWVDPERGGQWIPTAIVQAAATATRKSTSPRKRKN